MKILIVSRFADPKPLGSNNNVFLQAQSLARDFKLNVEILTWPSDDGWRGVMPPIDAGTNAPPMKVSIQGINYHLVSFPDWWRIDRDLPESEWDRAVSVGVNILKEIKPDIVHLHHWRGLWWLLESAQRLGIPTVYTNHDWGLVCMRTVLVMGNDDLCDGIVTPIMCARCVKSGRGVLGKINEFVVECEPGRRFIELLERTPTRDALRGRGVVREDALSRATSNYNRAARVLTRLNHCITPSRFGAEFFSRIGCTPDNITVLPWYHDSVNSRKTISDGQPFTITYIGRVSQEKGVHLIFPALEKVRDVEPVLLRIAGANDSAYCAQLRKKYSASVGIHRVEWIGWTAVEPLFQSTDVTIIASVWMDNTPLSLIESLSYRAPVIATRIPPMEELLVEGESGFLADYRSVDSLAVAIRRAVRKKTEIRQRNIQFPPTLVLNDYMARVVQVYKGIHAQSRHTQ